MILGFVTGFPGKLLVQFAAKKAMGHRNTS